MSNDYRILVSDKLAAEGIAVLKEAGLDVDQSTGLSADELAAIIGSSVTARQPSRHGCSVASGCRG